MNEFIDFLKRAWFVVIILLMVVAFTLIVMWS